MDFNNIKCKLKSMGFMILNKYTTIHLYFPCIIDLRNNINSVKQKVVFNLTNGLTVVTEFGFLLARNRH